MPRDAVSFNPVGGQLSVVLTNGRANQGQYDLTLLEPNEIDIAHRVPTAEFKSPAENTHVLPGAAAKHSGRVLDCVAAIGLLDPNNAYAVSMQLHQDGAVIGKVEDKGTAAGPAHAVELILELRAAAVATNAVV